MNPNAGGRAQPRRMEEVTEQWPPTTGRPGITQGRYGHHGNLELVVCDPEDGLRVGWFNHDGVESFAGASIGCWSGTLRFARGHRYVRAAVTQVDAGPDWLEVLALTDTGDLRRHVWSPAEGFVDHGSVGLEVTDASGAVVTASGDLVVATLMGTRIELLRATPGEDYPRLDVTPAPLAPPPPGAARSIDAAHHDDHLDVVVGAPDGSMWMMCRHHSDGEWHQVAEDATDARLATTADATVIVLATKPGRAVLMSIHPGERALEPLDLGPAHDVSIAAVRTPTGAQWHVARRGSTGLEHDRCARDLSWVASGPVVATGWRPAGGPSLHR